MSLINKMLQDLDARGGVPTTAGSPIHVRPVVAERRRTPWLLAGAAAVAVALAGAGYVGWRMLQRPAPVTAVVVPPVPAVRTVLLPPMIKPAPVAVVSEPAAAVASEPAPESLPASREAAPRALAQPVEVVEAAPRPTRKQLREEKLREQKLLAEEQRTEKRRLAAEQREAPEKAEQAGAAVRHGMGVPQRAEAEYRRALVTLQDGRAGDAIASLEQVLRTDPRHEAARQTLVSLLIEAGRPDEAARQLQQGLGADPRQPTLAMLLARLQIERGWTGIETLQRTLPYATGNAEYHAFLASALQRQARHREAAEQFQAALQTMPNNGVWLMGLGISLQADKRNKEAFDAFQKARASANLTPDLQGFVDRKVQQLSH